MIARVRERCRGDRGAAGALEFALITPLFMALAFAIVQAGLLWEAHNVLNAIASDAGRTARSYQSYPGLDPSQLPQRSAMASVANGEVTRLRDDSKGINSGGLAADVALDFVHAPSMQSVTVQVKGQAISLLGFHLPEITATSTGSYEGFRPANPAGAP